MTRRGLHSEPNTIVFSLSEKIVPPKNKMNKGLSFVLLILLIHYNNVVNANNKNCVTEDCLIGNNDLESEFYFGSHVARMLYDVSQSVSGQTGNSNNKAVNCPQSNGYRTCLPSKNGGGPNQSCGDYTRVC
ncbi:hypothetical protein JHK87_052255 [Glycine soja]|nr:hypothetical protein JHK86_052174 [Glycine max]KAG4914698.1 hypothetical protein JHK87_052255 [Glycine soja]